MTKDRVCANKNAVSDNPPQYHAYKLPDILEAISLVLAETNGKTWQKDVAIAASIADVGAIYAHNVVREMDREEARAALESVANPK